MKIFLAPRSNETSYKNFISTIEGGIDYSVVEPYLSEEGRKILSNEEKLFAWGTKESKGTSWGKMETGDLVLFYKGRDGNEREGKFFYAGRVLYKQHSKDLSLALWPPKVGEKPWSCVFFLGNLKEVYIPITEIADIAGYSRSFVVQGFMPLNYLGVQKIIEKFGSIERFVDYYSKVGERKARTLKSEITDLDHLDERLKNIERSLEDIKDILRGTAGKRPSN